MDEAKESTKGKKGWGSNQRHLLRCAHYFHSVSTTFHVNVKFLLNY